MTHPTKLLTAVLATLQERGGVAKNPNWYAQVINRARSASVMLPKAFPIVIGY